MVLVSPLRGLRALPRHRREFFFYFPVGRGICLGGVGEVLRDFRSHRSFRSKRVCFIFNK